jgi:glycine betaine/choline ABC-type transport system substrate-binding protein
VVVREESLLHYPGLRAALESLSGKLSEETMRHLNQQVDGEHLPVAKVATQLLDSIQQ